ncbi:MAG TPA: MFS transporter [Elusimicrobiota bacterium]|nr:MFS transporter [Elusimicrobiota bacterium]
MTSRHGFAEALDVLRIRDYRYFLCSRFFATLATQMQTLVISWQIYQLTRDPLALGLIGLVEAVVFIGFALYAGHMSDGHEKRRIILVTQAVMAGCAVALLALSGRQDLRPAWIYGIVAVTGLARSFMWPASFSYSELKVPKAIYSRAATMNSTAWEVGSIAGPAVGGILYAWKGPRLAYTVIMILTVAAMCFSGLMGPQPPAPDSGDHSTKGFWSGVRFVFSQPIILSALSLDMFAVFFGGVYAILPIFADRLRVGARGLGWLRAAPSAGAIVMAIYQAYRPPFARVGRTLLAAVGCFGASLIAFALSKSFWLCCTLLALSGMADNISVVVRASIVQAYTPNPLRGRVSSVNGIFIGSSNEIGAFESGLAAKLLGTVPSVIFGGVMTLFTVGIVLWASPALRQMRWERRPSAPDTGSVSVEA